MAASWAKFSENAIPSLVVAVLAGLVLFSFNETSDRITRLEDDIDTRFAELKDDTYAKFAELKVDIDAKFAAVDARFTGLKDDIDAKFAGVDARFTRLEDDIDARFTKLEENQQKIALTLARLVALFEAGDEAEAAPSG